jgi:hypothetical protein
MEVMDCRTCQPTLIDLVHDELATDAAAEAREHMKTCESCRASFKRLQTGLDLAQQLEQLRPPQRIEARLLQLAEARAHELAAARIPVEPKTPGPLQALVEFIGRFAMGRQVGMATITLLIVGLGLWSLPQLSRSPTVTGHSVVNPDASAEAAPSSGMQPAEPLDLKVDMRAGRIRSKDGQLERPAPSLPAAAPAAPQAPEAVAETENDPARALDDIDAPLDAVAAEDTLARKEAKKEAEANVRNDKGQAELRARSGGPEAFPQSPSAVAEPARDERVAANEAPRRAKESSMDDLLQGALRAESSGRAAGGAPLAPEPQPAAALGASTTKRVTTSQAVTPTAAPARAAAPAKSAPVACAELETRYAALAKQDASSAQAGEALIALARCKQKAGQTNLARSLLERATRNEAVASEARRMLAADSPAAEGKAKAAPAQQSTPAVGNSYR